jgi:hypothetical protein
MDRHITIKVISNMADDDPRDVEHKVNCLSDDGWLIDTKLTTPTRIVMQKWVSNDDQPEG